MKLSLSLSSFSVLSSRATAACTMSLARKRFLKPKWTPNVWTRMSFILMRRYREGEKNPERLPEVSPWCTFWSYGQTHKHRYVFKSNKWVPVFIGGLLNDVPEVLFDWRVHGVKFLLHLLQRQPVQRQQENISHCTQAHTFSGRLYPNSFILPSGSPHVRQELLKFLLPVYGPELKAAWRVAGVGDALVQGPVLVEGQTEAEDGGVRGNYRVAVQIKTSRRDRSHERILVFKWDSHAVDGQRVVVVFVAMVVSGNVSLHRGDVCHILHAKRKIKTSRGTPLCSQAHAIEWIATVLKKIFFFF